MITIRRMYTQPVETSGTLTADMLMDEESLRVMLHAFTEKIATAADIIQDSTIDDERMEDIIDHIRDLADSAVSIIGTIRILQDYAEEEL